ncbi:MAG: NUDIX domain-containing protein [Planctomycetes bacterium]|nr:NUDIX domain-containing protein [Planctomycetota bacterium]
MGRQQVKRWIEARALIQRAGRTYLIAKPHTDETCPWEFPGGKVRSGEMPEAVLRRVCRTALGVELEVLIGQPPFEHRFGTHVVTYRYCLCGIRRGEPTAIGYAEIRWILVGQLREYVFDSPTQQVVDWLLEQPSGK